MKYISVRKNNEEVSFQTAVLNGLSANGGLYVPEYLPQLPASFFKELSKMDSNTIAFEVLRPFAKGALTDEALQEVIEATLTFPMPVIPVTDSVFALELFHGPTQAFKDVGARFMAHCLSHFYTSSEGEITILVATSGDTGSAVAHGFYKVPGVAVKILFPKGKVSPFQEQQMTSLGGNITAIEVEGTFDDCQHLVKQAFQDNALRKACRLSSANSINVARLLPQMLYYFLAYQQLIPHLGSAKLVVAVPSGNLGNLTAGLWAKAMGLPIHRFVAAHNANAPFSEYLNTGTFKARPSVATCSNAMDVGNPSNFERIVHRYQHECEAVKKDVAAHSFSDAATVAEIKNCFAKTGYVLDPHGAVGKLGLEQTLKHNETGLFLETAHPQKFAAVMQKVFPNYTTSSRTGKERSKRCIANDYAALQTLLTETLCNTTLGNFLDATKF